MTICLGSIQELEFVTFCTENQFCNHSMAGPIPLRQFQVSLNTDLSYHIAALAVRLMLVLKQEHSGLLQ